MRLRAALLLALVPLAGLAAGAADYVRLPGGAFKSVLKYEDAPGRQKIAPFALMKRPVSNGEFLAFVKANPIPVPPSLVEQEAHTLFYPHGLGHLLGLGVRDASGLEPGRPKDPRPSLRSLRMDLVLRAGYITTVEPGLYFIPAILNDPARRAKYRDAVNWPLVEQHLHLGGVRFEDNLLITDGAPVNLTAAIPKGI